ncbi:hypothetical protein HFN80_36100 [Rhizobium laguerreae]|nr:hypothetical protein [Rhizobium laguerreae]
MASAKTLTPAEISMIKGMLSLAPRPKDQQILAHFTRPDRDLNHRVIGQIRKTARTGAIAPASETAVRAFMIANRLRPHQDASDFAKISPGPTGSKIDLRFLLLDWWPVGQGLFSSGALLAENGFRFNWVYDCGTSAKDSFLTAAIGDCQSRWSSLGMSKIDLAILSHFDHDHISGFTRLVRSAPIGTILLPYLTQLQRLVLALQQGVSADDAEFGFYLDPVGYLRGLEGGEIGDIVFVLPSDPDDGVPPAPLDPVPDYPGSPEVRLKYPRTDAPEATDDVHSQTAANLRVYYLERRGVITVPFVWEFLPYNDASVLPKVTKAFEVQASRLMKDLLTKPAARAVTLAALKSLYIKHFGKSSKNQNLISLFVYSGPLDQSAPLLWQDSDRPIGLRTGGNRFAQMYTGDGTLGAGKQTADLENHYRPGNRLSRAGVLQVMHHGAEGNWHSGLAPILNPEASIFSSDPDHKKLKHPNAAVLRDFWPYHPVQVDQALGLHIVCAF